ncbi:MAG TPA: glucose 1-dehydrogenase [Bryobacteraceae bacterium]|nr:glucose 1-dehydrogenase [Bryobacteraceae bacterium]
MQNNQPLAGKVAIVTGAGRLRGIGRATAVALAEMGADVAVTGTGRDPSRYPEDEKQAGWRDIESTAEQVRQAGRRCLPLLADVSVSADVTRAMAAVLSEFGRVDILVNNAAMARGEDRVALTELSEELWRKVLDVKLTGSFLMTKAALPSMIAAGEGGSIVNISSIAGKRGSARTAAYNVSNFGIQGFTQSMAMELAPYNIRVNAVCPGLIGTSRMDSMFHSPEWEAKIRNTIPLKRAGTGEEVAGLIAWICSPQAAYMTGQSINLDGGVVMS